MIRPVPAASGGGKPKLLDQACAQSACVRLKSPLD